MMTNGPPDALARAVEQLYGEMAQEFYLFSTHFLKASEILAELTSYYKNVVSRDEAEPAVVLQDEPVPDCTAPMQIQSVQVPQEKIVVVGKPTASAIKENIAASVTANTNRAAVMDEPPAAISLQEVRHRITLAAQAGYADAIKSLLARHGATKLSDVDPAQYQTLLADLDDLMKSEVNADG